MAADFRSLLNKKADEAKRPPILPAGTYDGIIKDFVLGESADKKTPYVRFNAKITGPTDDIDPEDLIDPVDNQPIDPAGRNFRSDFWLTEDADWRLTEFLQSCGIDTAGRSFGELLPEAKNASVLIQINQITARDKVDAKGNPEVYNNVVRMTGTANV